MPEQQPRTDHPSSVHPRKRPALATRRRTRPAPHPEVGRDLIPTVQPNPVIKSRAAVKPSQRHLPGKAARASTTRAHFLPKEPPPRSRLAFLPSPLRRSFQTPPSPLPYLSPLESSLPFLIQRPSPHTHSVAQPKEAAKAERFNDRPDSIRSKQSNSQQQQQTEDRGDGSERHQEGA